MTAMTVPLQARVQAQGVYLIIALHPAVQLACLRMPSAVEGGRSARSSYLFINAKVLPPEECIKEPIPVQRRWVRLPAGQELPVLMT